MLDPRIVAAKIHGCLALAHGEAIPDDSTKPSSQGVFIKIRMLQVAGLVQPALFSISEIVRQGSDRANEKS